jgi:hypothetical protein
MMGGTAPRLLRKRHQGQTAARLTRAQCTCVGDMCTEDAASAYTCYCVHDICYPAKRWHAVACADCHGHLCVRTNDTAHTMRAVDTTNCMCLDESPLCWHNEKRPVYDSFEPIRASCRCTGVNDCTPHEDGYDACICIAQRNTQSIVRCHGVDVWQWRACANCDTAGYCNEVDDGDMQCWCHQPSATCLRHGVAMASRHRRWMPLENEFRPTVVKPAIASCQCSVDGKHCTAFEHTRPTANDTLCVCFYNPSSEDVGGMSSSSVGT